MSNEPPSSSNIAQILNSALTPQVEEVSDDDTRQSPVQHPNSRTTSLPRSIGLVHVAQPLTRQLAPDSDQDDRSFVLVRRNPKTETIVRNDPLRQDNGFDLGRIYAENENAQATVSGFQPALPSPATQRRYGSVSASRGLSRRTRFQESLPPWSDVPRRQQMEIRSIARNFELIDRVLSTCINSREVLESLHQVTVSEEFPAGIDLDFPELSIAKFRLLCREQLQALTEDVGISRVNKVLTSPETNKFFHHPSEELLSYLSSQFDLPYWKAVLDWLSAMYRTTTKDSTYDFVRLIIYALESLTRSIVRDLRDSTLKKEARKFVLDGIDSRINLLLGLLDDTFPKTLQSRETFDLSMGNPSTAKNEVPSTELPTATSSGPPELAPDASLTALILISTIISIPFIGMGWAASDHKVGRVDSNFLFLVPSALIQLVGVVVVAKPLWRHSSPDAAWVWVWVWISITALCSIASVAFYVSLPLEWSSFTSYLAVAAQSLLGIQLMFTMPRARKV